MKNTHRANTSFSGLHLLAVIALGCAVPSGSRAAAFNQAANNLVNALAVQVDGKILVGGQFLSLAGQSRPFLARLHADGSRDNSYNPPIGGPSFSTAVYCLALDSNGNVLVGGTFSAPVSARSSRTNLARTTASGDLDPTFDAGLGGGWSFSATGVYSLALQPDDKVVVGGSFTSLGGQPRNGIGRLNANGTLDTGFAPAISDPPEVATLALQPDGKVLLGGMSLSSLGHGPALTNLTRLNPDGTIDETFDPVPGGASQFDLIQIFSLVIQPDGKILVGGKFDQLGGKSCTNLARLHPDGSLDTAFQPRVNGRVYALALQADGKVLVGGDFTTLAGQARSGFGRLSADGSLDGAFNSGAFRRASAIAIQADGEVLLAGGSSLTFPASGYVRRLNNPDSATQQLRCDGSAITWLRGGSSPEVYRAMFDFSTDGSAWINLGQGSRIPGGWQCTATAPPVNSILRARGLVTAGCYNGSGWFAETRTRSLPLILNDNSLGFVSGRFSFSINGGTGWRVVVERSPDLSQWTSIATNTLGQVPLLFTSPDAGLAPACFFRARPE